MNNILQAILNLFCSVEEKMVGIFEALGIFTKTVIPTVITVPFEASKLNDVVMAPNSSRQGFIVNNESSDDMYLSFDQNTCSDKFFTIKIPSLGSEYYIPVQKAYTGQIRIFFKDLTGTGFCTITELSYADS